MKIQLTKREFEDFCYKLEVAEEEPDIETPAGFEDWLRSIKAGVVEIPDDLHGFVRDEIVNAYKSTDLRTYSRIIGKMDRQELPLEIE